MTFSPRFMAASIGSTPHTDPVRACQLILESFPEAPVVPTLPRLSYKEGLALFRGGLPCFVVDEEKRHWFFDTSRNADDEDLTRFYEHYLAGDVDYFGMAPEESVGMRTMFKMLRENPSARWKLVKVGLRGPISCGLTLTDENRRPIFYNDTFRDALVKALTMKGKWLLKKLREAAPDVATLFQIGEPQMALFGSAFTSVSKEDVLACINEMIDGLGSDFTVIHCCANTDWPVLMATETDAISFDAYEFTESLALYPREVGAFLKRGGMLAWGIVPTADEKLAGETTESLVDRLEAGMALMSRRGVDKDMLLDSALVTPSCATTSMSVAGAERAHVLTKEMSETMRQRYFG
ncbi:MAG: hypothetical protein HYX92_16500 [Chloroflexi bacterium]|nr:hypothetical protein [Chloroflexota bacterium]